VVDFFAGGAADVRRSRSDWRRELAEPTICSQRKPRSFRCSAQPAGSRGVRRINVWAVSCGGFRPSINGEITKLIAQIETQHATLNKSLLELINATSFAPIITNFLSTNNGHSAPIMIWFGSQAGTRNENDPVQFCNMAATCCCRAHPVLANAPCQSNSHGRRLVPRCH
jgi:hypothetical protein